MFGSHVKGKNKKKIWEYFCFVYTPVLPIVKKQKQSSLGSSNTQIGNHKYIKSKNVMCMVWG